MTLNKIGEIWQIKAEGRSTREANKTTTKTFEFTTIDSACDFLQDVMLIPEQDVDFAVMNLFSLDHNTAVFNDLGRFVGTK